jgi:hypothetical protein
MHSDGGLRRCCSQPADLQMHGKGYVAGGVVGGALCAYLNEACLTRYQATEPDNKSVAVRHNPARAFV